MSLHLSVPVLCSITHGLSYSCIFLPLLNNIYHGCSSTQSISIMDQAPASDDKLFPTKSSFIVFVSYISLFVSQGLLVTAVQKSQIHGFNSIVVVLLTELVKLLICVAIYLFTPRGTIHDLIKDLRANRRLLVLYLLPAFLYCLYNNLTFINLKLFDLTTYYCLMQFRIVLTALIYQVIFQRKLTLIQWISLLILTTGCLIKEYGLYAHISQRNTTTFPVSDSTISHEPDTTQSNTSPSLKFVRLSSLLLLQMFCSCFAGVYNEYLLKDSSTSETADVIIQNMFMYLDSILCNVVVYTLAPSPSDDMSKSNDDAISVITILSNLLTSPLTIVLIFNNAFSGLVASFFLKSLNSILKTFASALELFAIALLAWLLFDDKIDSYTIIALILVSAAMVIYSRKPVSVAPPSKGHNDRYEFSPLPTSED